MPLTWAVASWLENNVRRLLLIVHLVVMRVRNSPPPKRPIRATSSVLRPCTALNPTFARRQNQTSAHRHPTPSTESTHRIKHGLPRKGSSSNAAIQASLSASPIPKQAVADQAKSRNSDIPEPRLRELYWRVVRENEHLRTQLESQQLWLRRLLRQNTDRVETQESAVSSYSQSMDAAELPLRSSSELVAFAGVSEKPRVRFPKEIFPIVVKRRTKCR